jgi:predicted CXXCH cytochrome family protein
VKRLGAALAAALASCALLAAQTAAAQIAATKHNLSVSGPGTVKAASETQICIFCHAPHNSAPSAPLWNRGTPGSSYVPYTSSTSKAAAGQPTGASLLCLSCHDGTIALGNVRSRATPIAMAAGATTMPSSSPGHLGTDLSDDHPVSVVYSAALAAARGELANPATLTGAVRLDSGGRLQCTTCHDAHDNSNGKFLVMSNQGSALCNACHVKNDWPQSAHRTSNAAWNGVAPDPWPHSSGTTVSANGCENCHRPHTAGGRKWLLNAAAEEANCYPCHNGNVAPKNIQAEFDKLSIHPVAPNAGTHDPAEPGVVQSRHVECVDCHNPHASNAAAGGLPGSLLGVRGIDINGAEVKPATAEYQICFRCHADSANKPAPRTARQIAQTNTRLEFATNNPSFHPIAGPGRSTNVPSLLPPWTVGSVIKCSDCHNNNAGPGAGGTGPKGPHGSTNTALLERPHALDGTPTAGDLCYKCHSRSVINSSAPHDTESDHLRYGCKACHDPHGISATQGNATYNSRLINLSTTDNRPVGSGSTARMYIDTVARRCYLVCHGESHNGESY